MQYLRYSVLILFCLIHATVRAQLPKYKQWENIYGTGENDNPHKLYDLGNGDFAANGFINGGLSGNDYGHWFVFDMDGQEKVSGFGAAILNHISGSAKKGLYFGNTNKCQSNNNSNFSDISVLITDSTGQLDDFCYGTRADDRLTTILNLSKNEKLIVGYRGDDNNSQYGSTNGGVDVWVIRTNADGEIRWQQSIGGSELDVAYFGGLDSDSAAIIAVYTESSDIGFYSIPNSSNENVVFTKVDLNGEVTILSHFKFDELNGVISYPSSMVQGDFFYIVGTQKKKGVLYKFNYLTGERILYREYGGSEITTIGNIFRKGKNHLIIGGKTESTDGDFEGRNSPYNTWLMELDSMGNIVDKFYPQGRGTAGNFVDFLLTDDEEIIVLSANGNEDNFPEHYGPFEHEQPTDFYIYKLGYSPVSSISDSEGFQSFSAFPNPNNTGLLNTNLKANYSLLDMQGRILKSYSHSNVLDISDINSGTYLLQHESGAVVKIVVGY